HAVSGCCASRATRPLGYRGERHSQRPRQDDHRVGARDYEWRSGAGGRGRYRANDAHAALGTGCRRVDSAVHRHARTVVAERVSSHRLRRAEGDGRERPARCAGACGRVGAVARVRRDSLVEFAGGGRSMTYHSYTEGPWGRMLFTADGHALTGMYFVGQKHEATPRSDWVEEDHVPLFIALRGQLAQYFQGQRHVFDVPLAAHGTPFQQRVWQALRTLEYGMTMSYGKLAEAIGLGSSVRAVAAAVGRNP